MAPNCYVNKVRLKDYIDGFVQSWPGSKNVTLPSSDTLKVELAKLRSEGRLEDYDDVELLTNVLRTTWRKP